MRRDLSRQGIAYTTSQAHKPESNDVAKMINRILMNKVKTMLNDTGT